MARAKRTDRAEARRKYRAYLLEQQEAEAAAAQGPEGAAGGPGPTTGRTTGAKPGPTAAPGARLGIVAAARAAYRQPHYVDDIRNVGSLVFHSNAIWPILVMSLVAGAYGVIRSGVPNDPIWLFLVQFIFYPVPLLPPMLAGFLAPRSTWLAGLISSFIATITLVAVVAVTPTESLTASSSTAASVSSVSLLTFAVYQLMMALAFGALMGALSGWYKRFLSFTSGPRTRPTSKSGGGRPQQRSPQRRSPTTRG